MKLTDHYRLIQNIIQNDPFRLEALNSLNSLGIGGCLIAAGFVRNAIWDHLYHTKTSLNDVDVIYYCANDVSESRDEQIQQRLNKIQPNLLWSVKNQARMHIRNDHQAYSSVLDAMNYWPEKQTAIGVCLGPSGELEIQYAFKLAHWFSGKITHNTRCPKHIFNRRVAEKQWLLNWPELSIE